MRKLGLFATGLLLALTGGALAPAAAHADDTGSPSVAAAPDAAPTAAQLLVKVTSCHQISNGKYRRHAGAAATIPVGGKNGAVFWKADMDIDCDGQRTAQCNKNRPVVPGRHHVPPVQRQTAERLHPALLRDPRCQQHLPVLPAQHLRRYRDRDHLQEQAVYAVFGDTGPTSSIGETSYATAKALGINPDPRNGGVDSGVTYIVFQGAKVSPIQDHTKATSVGTAAAQKFLANN